MRPETLHAVLDPAVVDREAPRLPALAGRLLRPAVLSSVWVKPGRHFNACYALGDGGAAPLVAALAVDAERVRRRHRHRCDGGGAAGCPACAMHQVSAGLLLQLFPFDYRLPTLPACLDPATVGAALGLPVRDCQPSGYRPGMRCQIRYRLDDGRVLFGKVAVEREPGRAFATLAAVHAALRDDARVRIPAPVRHLPDLGLTVAAALDGRSLDDLPLTTAPPADVWARIAVALAALHGLPGDDIGRVHGPADELALARDWVAQTALVLPEFGAALQAAATALAAGQPAPRPPRALVHRDFYEKQVLLADDAPVALLDLDTACHGDPELDLGNAAAHLRLRAVQAGAPALAAAPLAALLAAYPGAVEPARLEWYRRASLLRLACIYALRPPWRHLAPILLAAAAPEAA